jgi:hypothetical protein
MCQNAQSVTLQTAVLMQVKEFAQNNQTFSVHDITRTIRSKVRQGDLEIPEAEVAGASFRFDIPHAKVKALFLEMWNSGVFDPDFALNRLFNQGGGYFEYTPTLTGGTYTQPAQVATAPVATAPANVAVAPTAVAATPVPDSVVQDRINVYLNNCEAKNFRPTLKQVQSAIKRDVSTGWTCTQIQDYVEKLGYKVVADPDYVSASQVATV